METGKQREEGTEMEGRLHGKGQAKSDATWQQRTELVSELLSN